MKAKPKLRKWTRCTLRKEDYAFAVSDDPKKWNSPARKWSNGMVGKCLLWEGTRELEKSDKAPFVTAFRNLIKTYRLPKPSELPPLVEINELQTAIKAISEQPGFPIRTVHVLEIEDHSDTKLLVQRFRNWLTAKAAKKLRHGMKNGEIVLIKKHGWRFTLCNGGSLFFSRGDPGRRTDYGNRFGRPRTAEFKEQVLKYLRRKDGNQTNLEALFQNLKKNKPEILLYYAFGKPTENIAVQNPDESALELAVSTRRWFVRFIPAANHFTAGFTFTASLT